MNAPFAAWALPSWSTLPADPIEVELDEGFHLYRLRTDREWLGSLGRGLATRAWSPLAAVGASADLAVAPPPPAALPSLSERVRILGAVGRRFADPGDPLRHEALRLLPHSSGLSGPMSEAVLDRMARDWLPGRLERLVEEEFGSGRVLEGFVTRRDRSVMAVAPRLCVQIVAGSVPGVGVNALIRSLLVGAPTLLKPGGGDVVLSVLFARALGDVSRTLADRVAVAYWPGDDEVATAAALRDAEVIVAYGGDHAVGRIRAAAPATARFVGYHHREGIGVVGSEALASDDVAAEAARSVARAVAFFDQRGCVSTRTVYVEDAGAAISPASFAEHLARALADLEDPLPSGVLGRMERAALHQMRGTAEMLSMVGTGGLGAGAALLWHGARHPWTVFLDPDGALETTCVGRVVLVRPFGSARELVQRLIPVGPHLQTAGVTGLGERLSGLAEALGRLGVSRVAPFDAVPFPVPWWHHDGRGPLTDLVRWVDLEGGASDADGGR